MSFPRKEHYDKLSDGPAKPLLVDDDLVTGAEISEEARRAMAPQNLGEPAEDDHEEHPGEEIEQEVA